VARRKGTFAQLLVCSVHTKDAHAVEDRLLDKRGRVHLLLVSHLADSGLGSSACCHTSIRARALTCAAARWLEDEGDDDHADDGPWHPTWLPIGRQTLLRQAFLSITYVREQSVGSQPIDSRVPIRSIKAAHLRAKNTRCLSSHGLTVQTQARSRSPTPEVTL
jgi:hypothetical protein